MQACQTAVTNLIKQAQISQVGTRNAFSITLVLGNVAHHCPSSHSPTSHRHRRL